MGVARSPPVLTSVIRNTQHTLSHATLLLHHIDHVTSHVYIYIYIYIYIYLFTLTHLYIDVKSTNKEIRKICVEESLLKKKNCDK